MTGGAGFIGSHLVETLVSIGASVRTLVRYNSRNSIGNITDLDPTIQDKIDITFGNISDPYHTSQAVKDIDIVFHLAALIGIPYSYIASQQYIITNILGTLNVLEACREHSVAKIVHTSTSETYGTAKCMPQDEEHPLQAQSPYAATKIGADKLAESYFLSFDLPVAIIRPFNTYGPRQSARAIIPTLISQVLCREEIHVGNLTPRRDFNFVTDTVSAFLAVGATDKTTGQVLNVGSGTLISIGKILEIIQRIQGQNKPVIIDQERIRPEKSEVMQLQCDNRKIQKLTGWKPSISLEEGLRLTINWVSRHLEYFDTKQYTV